MSNFIDKKYINSLITKGTKPTTEQLDTILEKAKSLKGLSHDEVALLIAADSSYTDKLLAAAGEVKQGLYKNRVVLFAPLYISNYCKNECSYCGYKHSNKFERHILDKGAIEAEVQALERLGHKRLALEVGEDLENCSFEYILEAIDTIYASGDIRRINVNLAATTIENYKKLHEKEIGTYILFQETYDEDAFRFYHKGPKGDYVRQLLAHHRAMQAGIEDVGGGVLFGLSD